MTLYPDLPKKRGVFDKDAPPLLTYLSLGAGVQSTALYLMAATGEIEPRPDVAIFADTTHESEATYEHLERIKEWQAAENGPPIEVVRAPHVNMKRVPSYNKTGMYRRRCTMDWKIRPIHQHVRGMVGLNKGQLFRRYVVCVLGISVDEAHRMSPSRKYWEIKTFPLVAAQTTRQDCERVIDRFGFGKVEGSACVFCPFQSSARWRAVRKNPREWEKVLKAEAQIDGTFHRSGLPIEEALALDQHQGELFAEECTGVCGV